MTELKGISRENRAYWSQRSAGYSDVNRSELAGVSRAMWKKALHDRISAHFGGRPAETVRVLDIGTGPGFFAVILTELGYDVTAIDLTPEMLGEARKNAGDLADLIDFREMNAEELEFGSGTFDVTVSRNLTWNLPHPEKAYSEWARVLRPGGLMLNFDSNWYGYLFDEDAMKAYEEDRLKSEALGLGDQNVGENFDVMEDIARRMPLSATRRPGWDVDVLSGLDMTVSVNENIWQDVWTHQEQVNFASTPMFMVHAVRQ